VLGDLWKSATKILSILKNSGLNALVTSAILLVLSISVQAQGLCCKN
jgi:hypothetical protein